MKVDEIFIPHLILGLYCSIALPMTLWELLISPQKHHVKKYSLVFSGLFTCLYVSCFNIYILAVLSLKEIDKRKILIESLGLVNSFLSIFDLEIDWELAESRKLNAYVILGYGAVMSLLFFMGCLVKYFGMTFLIHFYKVICNNQDTLIRQSTRLA